MANGKCTDCRHFKSGKCYVSNEKGTPTGASSTCSKFSKA